MRSLELGDGASALPHIDAALGDVPAHAELLRLRGLGLLLQDQIAAAVASFKHAVALRPDDALIVCQLGTALACAGDVAAAERAFRRAAELDPRLIDAWYNLGHALDQRADVDGARAAFEQVLAIEPAHVSARIQRAEMLKMLGRLGEAEDELRNAVANDRDCIAAWVGLSNLNSFQPSAQELDHLLRLQAGADVPPGLAVDLAFACATLLERGERYADAFRLFTLANAAKRRSVQWNANAVSGLIDDILAQFSALPPLATHTTRGGEVIFLVGMPRSGSTLAEQILSSHPLAQGGGERDEIARVLQDESRRRSRSFPYWVADATDADWARLGLDYLDRCRQWRDSSPRFTNKTLTNWQTLGAIRRMLPGAHIVHCQRDPLETLWSCYKHHFDGQLFTYDIDDLTAFRRDCARAMHAWAARWPGWIHAQVYEELLQQPDACIRGLLAHCDLPFDAACLAFHENPRTVQTSSASQVREPLRGIEMAPRYGKLLDSLRRNMGPVPETTIPSL